MSSWQLFVELLQLGTNLGGIIFRSCRRHWCLSVSQFLDTASCGFCCRVSWGDFAAAWDDGTGRLGAHCGQTVDHWRVLIYHRPDLDPCAGKCSFGVWCAPEEFR